MTFAKKVEDSGFRRKHHSFELSIQIIFVSDFLWNFRVTKKVVKRMCQNILARKFKDDDNYRRRATFHTF